MSDDGVFDVIDLAFEFDDSDPAGMTIFSEDTQSSPDEVLPLNHSVPSWIGNIENLLMNDEEDDVVDADGMNRSYLDDFLSDVLLDVPADAELTPSDQKSSQSDVSDSVGKDDDAEAKAADDPDSKKRKRQLRNKDAALRSREKKKMYVKELELKSRYLEGECRRLGRLLQCCYAENQDLRFRFHMGNGATGAAMTKQESAVLFLESLLLGSLFWFLGIMCLFHLPKLISSKQEVVVLQGIVKNDPRSVHRKRAKNNQTHSPAFGTFFKSRRCKALRSKIKPLCSFTSILRVLMFVCKPLYDLNL